MTPQQAAAQLWDIDPATLTAIRIKNGLTNVSYCIGGGPEEVVVRFSITDERALQLNRASETVVLDLVEQAAIGAAVLHCDPAARVLITRKLAGRNLESTETGSDDNIARVSGLLRQLHSLPVPQKVQATNLVAILQAYWESIDSRMTLNDHLLQERVIALRFAEESSKQAFRCLCHNDVHHLNLIDDGQRLWLLDWEYAGIGDPYFDLASVCCYHRFNEAQRNLLLACYAKTSSLDQTRLKRMCWLFDYIKGLWFAVRAL